MPVSCLHSSTLLQPVGDRRPAVLRVSNFARQVLNHAHARFHCHCIVSSVRVMLVTQVSLFLDQSYRFAAAKQHRPVQSSHQVRDIDQYHCLIRDSHSFQFFINFCPTKNIQVLFTCPTKVAKFLLDLHTPDNWLTIVDPPLSWPWPK